MADTPATPPITQADIDLANQTSVAIDKLNDSTKQATNSLNSMNNVFKITDTIFSNITSGLSDFSKNLNNTNEFGQNAINTFGLLATGLVGVRESFNSLNNVDTRGLSTFQGQVDSLLSLLNNKGTAPNIVKEGISLLGDTLKKANAPIDLVDRAMKGGLATISAYAKTFITAADNGLKLQNALIQLSAQTGNLGLLYKAAGDDLTNMNEVLAKQSNFLGNATRQTNLSADQVEQYFNQLATIPGVLEETSVKMDGSGIAMNKLTATIQLATGSGRKYEDVVNDIKKATVDYGLSFGDAMRFTAQIGEIANKFQIPLKNVEDALTDNVNHFKMFADAGEAAAQQFKGFNTIINSYEDSLKKTGLTSAGAIDVIHNMTNAVAGLKIEQKAFLSQQTGGPGGLVGGFQIEKMLREGRTAEVFEKVRLSMQKQFGQIATLDEASKDPGAANRLTKQSLLLQQGPLGQFAQNPQQAYRILEMFRERQEGRRDIQSLDPNAAMNQIGKGKAIQDLSNTPLSSLRGTLESARYTANIANFSEMQKYFTAGTGTRFEGETKARGELREDMKRSPEYRPDMNLGMTAAQNTKDVIEWGKKLPDTMKAMFSGITDAANRGDYAETQNKRKQLQQELAANHENKRNQEASKVLATIPTIQASNTSPNFKQVGENLNKFSVSKNEYNTELNNLQSAIMEGRNQDAEKIQNTIKGGLDQTYKQMAAKDGDKKLWAQVNMSKESLDQAVEQLKNNRDKQNTNTAGDIVGNAVQTNTTANATNVNTPNNQTNRQNTTTAQTKTGSLGTIAVTVNTKCNSCGKSILGNNAAEASPQVINVSSNE